MNTKILYGPKTNRPNDPDQWSREVEFPDGRKFTVRIERGNRVRIAYKPRGENWGYKWWGHVYVHATREQLRDQVTKSTGAIGILHANGIFLNADEVQHVIAATDERLDRERKSRYGSMFVIADLEAWRKAVIRLNKNNTESPT